MKNWFVTLPLLLAVSLLSGQAFNTTLRDQLTYTQALNDVWGYVAPDGTEYALVGTRTGLSIVSLADPDNISEVAFIGGDASTWRDIKTYQDYAYVVTDSGDDGLLIVDLSNLTDPIPSVSHQYYNLTLAGGTFNRAHNIYIDTLNGIAYLAGANRNSGGMILLDLTTVPGQASQLALAPSIYSHDVYVQNDLMYASEINAGRLNIYDVSNINNITSLGTRVTPNSFTHNAWSNADDSVVFTTDERPDAPTAAYDVSDPSNPILLSEFRPSRSVGSGTIPHNAHVLDEYVVISHYTDGLEIVDASVPSNPIEVAYYDTWPGADGGFNGTWGAYPFLPSGLVLATDISNGLFVVEVDYQLAARIKGNITEGSFGGANLNGVSVSITNPSGATTTTNASGFYQSGFPNTGTYTVTFSLPGYLDVITNVDFVQGTEVVLDTFLMLDAGAQSMVSGLVLNTATGGAVDDAQVVLDGPDAIYTDNSDGGGQLNFGFVLEDTYTASSGKWGFENRQATISITGPSSLNFQLTPGFLDGFVVDQGWTTSSTPGTTSGFWERGIPVGTTSGGSQSNPGSDVNGGTDIGDQAYVTGNGGGSAGTDDVDNGDVLLISPVIDFSVFPDPSLVVISYDYWFFNAGGSGTPNDELTIDITNGIDTENIATYTNSSSVWTNVNFNLRDLSLALTPNMQLIITTGDASGSGHLVEAGFDDFRIYVDPALPVELTSFTARKQSESTALLNWTTASESGNRGFAVERGSDGSNFTAIGFVNGQGDSRFNYSYEFVDAAPENGLNYYRLRQVDLDGTESFSQVRSLEFDEDVKSTITTFPNPAGNQLWLSGVAPEAPAFIYSADGRLMLQFTTSVNGRVDISQLPSGSYVVKVANEVARFVKK